MRTPLCDELGIEFPIFAFTHCRDVVVAVSKAGGMGVLGAVGFTPEQLEVEMAWIDEHIGDRPYGIDIVIPQKYEGMDDMDPEHLSQTLREMVPTSRTARWVGPAAPVSIYSQSRGRPQLSASSALSTSSRLSPVQHW